MLIGAFGPWIKALGQSVGGTDGANDGWLVVAAAIIGTALFYARRASPSAGLWAVLAGIAGLVVTVYDRSNIQDKINHGGALLQAVAQVGWGLNLALAASISMAVAGVVFWVKTSNPGGHLSPPVTPPPETAPTPQAPPPSPPSD